MLRLLIDENFDQRILRGLKLELPDIDYLVVQETEAKRSPRSACPFPFPFALGSKNPQFEIRNPKFSPAILR